MEIWKSTAFHPHTSPQKNSTTKVNWTFTNPNPPPWVGSPQKNRYNMGFYWWMSSFKSTETKLNIIHVKIPPFVMSQPPRAQRHGNAVGFSLRIHLYSRRIEPGMGFPYKILWPIGMGFLDHPELAINGRSMSCHDRNFPCPKTRPKFQAKQGSFGF